MKVFKTPNENIELVCPENGTPFLKYYEFETTLSHFSSLVYIGKRHNGSEDKKCLKHVFTYSNKWLFFSSSELITILKDSNMFTKLHEAK